MITNFNEYMKYLDDDCDDRYSHVYKEGLTFSSSYNIFNDKITDLLQKSQLENSDVIKYNSVITNSCVKTDILLNKTRGVKLYHDIFSVMSVLGYYISYYQVDGGDSIVKNLDIKTFTSINNRLTIFFNKKFDFEDNSIKPKLYHVTDSKYMNRIKKNGLVPRSGSTIDNYDDRLYLFDNKNTIVNFINEKMIYAPEFDAVVLEINTRKLNKLRLHSDPKYKNKDAFYTYDIIPLSALKDITEQFINPNYEDE